MEGIQLESKKGIKWYINLLKRLLYISIHNAYMLYREFQNIKKINHPTFRLQRRKELFEVHSKALDPSHPEDYKKREHITARHFAERIPPSV
jgi:hypothetical protein